jgi:hypothetical protein
MLDNLAKPILSNAASQAGPLAMEQSSDGNWAPPWLLTDNQQDKEEGSKSVQHFLHQT